MLIGDKHPTQIQTGDQSAKELALSTTFAALFKYILALRSYHLDITKRI